MEANGMEAIGGGMPMLNAFLIVCIILFGSAGVAAIIVGAIWAVNKIVFDDD
jgi:hypothetical protein